MDRLTLRRFLLLVVLPVIAADFLIPDEQAGGPTLALTFTVTVLISIGLSIAAGAILARKNKNLAEDDKPTATATRGSFVPWVRGRRRIGYVFGGAWNRRSRKERAGGKGDLTTPKQKFWFEDGWHILCIGPGSCLVEIEQAGKVIFEGPITPDSHPSGSMVDVGKEGQFYIYWGEDDQPLGVELADSTRVGIRSRWPNTMYIVWTNKRLGTSPNWPLMTYVVEVAPPEIASPGITAEPAYMEGTYTLHPTDQWDVDAVLDGAQGVGYFDIVDTAGAATRFKPKQKILVQNNTGLGTDTEFTIARVFPFLKTLGPGVVEAHLWIYPEGGVDPAVTADGEIRPYDHNRDDGYNPAHIIYGMLFDPWPHGLAQDQSKVDISSLTSLATLCVTENFKASVAATQGATVEKTLGSLLQDLGVMWTTDPTTGKLTFVPVREPTGTLPHIPLSAQTGKPIELEKLLIERPVDTLVFSFPNRDNNYREDTITITEDGQAALAEFFRQRVVGIPSTVNFDTAAAIAERRSFEEHAGASKLQLQTNRGARTLKPGDAFTAEDIDEVLRVTGTRYDPNSGIVTITCASDFYGAQLSEFQPDPGDHGDDLEGAEPDVAFDLLEVPEWLIDNQTMTVIFVRIRQHSAVTEADLHISRDDTTFEFVATDQSFMAGGTLDADFPANSDQILDEGPEITIQGPDIGSVEDLSSDTVSWRRGRQFVIFRQASTGKLEIGFLKKVTALGGDTYRLDGVIRSRYNTEQLELSSGDQVFIFQDDDSEPIQDILLEPQVTLYGKSQPAGNGQAPLAGIVSQDVDLYGKGVRPEPVANIQLDQDPAGSGNTRWTDFYYSLAGSAPSDDLDIVWRYFTPRSPNSGAGIFAAGAAVGDADPEGNFLVEILTSGDSVVRSTTVSTPSYTYLRADRIADFTGEPALFKVRVTQQRGGQVADSVTQTFTQV